MRSASFTVVAITLSLVSPSIAIGQSPKRPAAEITAPKSGAKVNHVELVEGHITPPGHPVILVMPLSGDQPWYVQDGVEGVDADGHFTARIHIGEEKAQKNSSKFRIVILVVKDEKEASKKYTPGTQLKNLPNGTPRSEVIPVVREVE